MTMNRRLTLRDIAGKKPEETKEPEKGKEPEKPKEENKSSERVLRLSRREDLEVTPNRIRREEKEEPEDNKKPVRTARVSEDEGEEAATPTEDSTEDSSEDIEKQIDEMRKKDPNYLKISPPGSGDGGKWVELPEDEIFDAVVEKMNEIEMYNRFKKKTTTKIRIIFSIIDDKDYEGCKASCLVTKSIHEKSTLFEILQIIFGDDIDLSEGYDATDLIGEKCRIKVNNKFKDDKKKPGEKRVFPSVIQILQYSKSKSR